MANMCSVDFNMVFKTPKAKNTFIKDFKNEIEDAKTRNEGVKIADFKWLFDAEIKNGSKSIAILRGWVKWSIEHESIREFTEKHLKKMGIKSFDCFYEETGNGIYGKYIYENGELFDFYLDDSHPIWTKANIECDEYLDELDNALEEDGIFKQVG